MKKDKIRSKRCKNCVCPLDRFEKDIQNEDFNDFIECGAWECYMHPETGRCKGASDVIKYISKK